MFKDTPTVDEKVPAPWMSRALDVLQAVLTAVLIKVFSLLFR